MLVPLVCPVCSAPLAANDSRCPYCGTVVVVAVGTARIDPAQIDREVVDEQIEAFRAELRNRPTDAAAARAHYGLGVAYFNLGLTDDAVDALLKAARLTPENPRIQAQLAAVYAERAERGDRAADAKARDRIGRALRVDPDCAEALLVLAELELRAGDWTGAAAIWQRVAAANPDAVRRPVADFLRAHLRTTLRAPIFWSHPQRAERRAAVTREKVRWLAGGAAAVLLLFLVGSLLLRVGAPVASLGVPFELAAAATAIGAYVVGRRAVEAARERVAALDMTPAERELLSGETGDGRVLADVATRVAAELQRQRDAAALPARQNVAPAGRRAG